MHTFIGHSALHSCCRRLRQPVRPQPTPRHQPCHRPRARHHAASCRFNSRPIILPFPSPYVTSGFAVLVGSLKSTGRSPCCAPSTRAPVDAGRPPIASYCARACHYSTSPRPAPVVELDFTLRTRATSASCVTTMIVVSCSCNVRNKSSTIRCSSPDYRSVHLRESVRQLINARACTRAAARRLTAGCDGGRILQPDRRALQRAARRPRNGSIARPSRSPPPSNAAQDRTLEHQIDNIFTHVGKRSQQILAAALQA